MSCISHKAGQNCAKGDKCPNGYECCQQKGNENKFGLCVRKNQCNKETGVAVKGCKDPVQNSSIYESFIVKSKEGYTDKDDNCCSCSSWTNAFMILFIVISVLVFIIASMYLKSAKIR